MRCKLLSLAALLLLPTFNAIHGQDHLCIENFEEFDAIEAEVYPAESHNIYESVTTMAWYTDSNCILLGSSSGLWLYDIDYPNDPLMLGTLSNRTIENIAVNPADSRIAFSITHEPTVYIINADQTTSNFTVDSPAVTSIAFSPDGTLMAVASSEVGFEEWVNGFYYDPKVQIWNVTTQSQVTLLAADTGFIETMFLTPDNRHLLTTGIRQGYIGNDIEYWDIATTSRTWSYDDLFLGLEKRSVYDPLAVQSATQCTEKP